MFGATSAIAEQVARLYAAKGARIFLAGRQRERLDTIAQDLQVRGASAVSTYGVDFDDVAAFGPMVEACGSPDRTLIAYGTLPDQQGAEGSADLTAKALLTNFTSPAVLLNLLADRLHSGAAVAVITSVAGERGRQSNYVYGAAKGGLSRFLEGLRHRLAPKGIRVIDVRPGFVDTPMTDGMDKKGPLWAKPERVARDIEKALERRDGPIHTPWFWWGIMAIITRVPARIFHKTKL
ncbi:SDR family oxidoreductase [Sphingomonas telluris]|uniref:SDR family oxidoreductase n=1 Tax=Sphingomonas telluris TaxID=2907998 RepID=UPI00344D951B